MALVLLVVGALMSGAGIYAVIHGYSIIQVEEGWASVISGATLLAGGVLTVALGLVLRVLGQVKAGLDEAPARVVAEVGGAPEVAVPAKDPTFGEFTATPPAAPSTNAPSPIGATSPTAATEAALAVVTTEQAMPPPSPFATARWPLQQFPLPAQLADEAKLEDAPQAEPDINSSSTVEPEPTSVEPHPADDYKLETPTRVEHDFTPANLARSEPTPAYSASSHLAASDSSQAERYTTASAEAAMPPMDDWLDRAFAELDRDNPPLSPPTQPVPQATSEPPAAPTPTAEASTADAVPQSAAPPSDAEVPAQSADQTSAATPPPAPQPSAIIGRYESEGTTYVMFADGSIEAQSATGVYRFASMAELKSFIER